MLAKGQHMAIERRKAYEGWLLAQAKRAHKARVEAERDSWLSECEPLPTADSRRSG